MIKKLTYIIFLLLIFSCKKDELGPQCVNCSLDNNETEATDLIIINEGNFGWGNGSLSLYKPTSKTVSNNVYQHANNSNVLGDVVQSAYQFNSNLYIVANNSGKIEVIDENNFKNVATISGFNSPRYFLPVSNSKAYVTDLYFNSIQIVDLTSNSITGSINTNGWTEQLLMHNDSVYVCDMTNDNLLIINPSSNNLVDSIKLGVEPNSLVLDKNNKLWILCSGGSSEDNGKLIRFNPTNRSIEATYVFPNISHSPSRLTINSSGDRLYFSNNSIYRMNIGDVALPGSAFINNNSNIFYGLAVDPVNEDVYVADAIDYIQNGIVFRYSSSGSLMDQFYVGIIPGEFLFIK